RSRIDWRSRLNAKLRIPGTRGPIAHAASPRKRRPCFAKIRARPRWAERCGYRSRAVEGDAEVVVVGAGQAGLAVSHELSRARVEHVVLEKDRVGATWRRRWDSFCLVTPNWSVLLPGHPYDGGDPDGFMSREEVVGYLERYTRGFRAPVHEGIEVTSLRPLSGHFALKTSAGGLKGGPVGLSPGAHPRPDRPGAPPPPPPPLLPIPVAA